MFQWGQEKGLSAVLQKYVIGTGKELARETLTKNQIKTFLAIGGVYQFQLFCLLWVYGSLNDEIEALGSHFIVASYMKTED